MKAGWQLAKLGDVCNLINRGISPKYLEEGGVCVLNQKCIRDHVINYALARRHDITTKKVSEERFIHVGDVLINSTGTGTLGRVAQIREEPKEPTTVDSHVTIVRPKPNKFFQDFFGYMLIFIEDEIKAAGEGCGGQTELAKGVLANGFTVAYPDSIIEQQRIVAILDEAFEAIAVARTNAEQNRQNARALFESYLQSIFSQHIDGWKHTTLEMVLTVQPQNGWSPPAANHSDSGTPVLTLSSVTGFQFKSDKIKYTSALTSDSGRYWVRNGDLLITRSNTPNLVGHVAIAKDINQPTIYPDLIMRMIPDTECVITEFLYFQMRTPELRKIIMGRAQGANPTMKKISNGAVRTLPIVVPPITEQKKIVRKLNKLTDETQCLESLYQLKIAALDELKQSLLQQAFSGQLDTSRQEALTQ